MTRDDFRRAGPALLLVLAATVWLAGGGKAVEAHGSEARYVEVAPWERDRIPRVLAVSRSELGTPGTRRTMEVRDVDGRSCLVGALFALDVDDASGRAPLPSDRALSIHRFTDEIRLLRVNARTAWPSSNRLAFYVDGGYESRLPAGAYELVVTRGPEYRSHRSTIEITPPARIASRAVSLFAPAPCA